MGLLVRENLHWCVCQGRIVILDLEADRYFALPNVAAAAFLRLMDETPQPDDLARLRPLLERGMLVEPSMGATPTPRSPIEVPVGGFGGTGRFPARAFDIAAALLREAQAALLLRRKRLVEIASLVSSSARDVRSANDRPERLARIAAAFQATGLVLPVADRCLVRTLAMHLACSRHGIRPRFVFGVRLDPFRAHCWLDLDGQVLTGDFEQVRLFVPILALG